MSGGKDKLLFIQYGDFRADMDRLSSGGSETYQAQAQSMQQVVDMVDRYAEVTIVNVITDDQFDQIIPQGVRVIGLGPDGQSLDQRGWWDLLDRVAPDRLILRTPLLPALRWAERHRRRTLATLADSFQGSGLKAWLRTRRLRRLLNGRSIEYVANHGRRSSFQLRDMGVNSAKVVPWDWPPHARPDDQGAKLHPESDHRFTLLFVGLLTTAKGADDLVDAVAELARRGLNVDLVMVGKGDSSILQQRAEVKGVGGQVRFLGVIPNREVAQQMRAADAVIVPSRHDYPEGLPLTIYESFCSRTPLIVSNHPMFLGNVVDGQDGLMFDAANPSMLADKVQMLVNDPTLYAALSRNSAAAWQRLQLPVTWGELIDRWLRHEAEDIAWIDAHALSSGRYDQLP